ncbi:MAG: penicillin acylase family protein [Spirochaetota bacterium]|nr:MAG: penicillin acylase family protein [Spirochaetota bacterium]
MRLRKREVTLQGQDGKVSIRRNDNGVPEVRAETMDDIAFGLGWVHSNDRQLQVLLMRIVLRGQAAEHLKAIPDLIKLDKYMRRMNFLPDAEKVIKMLEPHVKRHIERYTEGFNLFLSQNGVVPELRLLGYKPPTWDITDSLLIGKVFGFLGLTDTQGKIEKFIIQLIQNKLDETKLRELFPYLTDEIDYELIGKILVEHPQIPHTIKWFAKIPKFIASNNCVISGKFTESGKPIICGDIHLQINRLPSIWEEIVMLLPDNKMAGVSIPGTPGLVVGRTKNIAWAPTYTFIDMLDYRIEHCKDGKYRRDNMWKDFKVREEVIKVKKGKPIIYKVFENEHGALEGEPYEEGYYLTLNWSAKDGCGAGEFNSMVNLANAQNVREAMNLLKGLDAASFNWVIADTQGNIGLQMSGRCFQRPDGVSGLVPLPAWDRRYDQKGFVDKDKLPSSYNPDENIIITANNDINDLGSSKPINLPMASYRAERIATLVSGIKNVTVDDMKKLQYDLYSLQAERFMKLIRPLLPDTKNGKILREWDLHYDLKSKGAGLFESVYVETMRKLFGEHGFGADVFEWLVKETGFFHNYYGNLDNIIFNEHSSWFDGMTREDILKKSIEDGLKTGVKRYRKMRKIKFSHILFGDNLIGKLGYNYGPVRLGGSRATIPQGQILKNSGGVLVVAPSYRMVADLSTSKIHANVAGGASDRRFSRWYRSDVKNWLKGVYKTL